MLLRVWLMEWEIVHHLQIDFGWMIRGEKSQKMGLCCLVSNHMAMTKTDTGVLVEVDDFG